MPKTSPKTLKTLILALALLAPGLPLAVLHAAPDDQAAQKAAKVVVLEPHANASVSASHRTTLRGALEEAVSGSRSHQVVNRATLDKLFREGKFQKNGFRVVDGLPDEGSTRMLGGLTGAEFVLAANLYRDETYYNITCWLIEAETGEVRTANGFIEKDSPQEIQSVAGQLVAKLLGQAGAEPNFAKARVAEMEAREAALMASSSAAREARAKAVEAAAPREVDAVVLEALMSDEQLFLRYAEKADAKGDAEGAKFARARAAESTELIAAAESNNAKARAAAGSSDAKAKASEMGAKEAAERARMEERARAEVAERARTEAELMASSGTAREARAKAAEAAAASEASEASEAESAAGAVAEPDAKSAEMNAEAEAKAAKDAEAALAAARAAAEEAELMAAAAAAREAANLAAATAAAEAAAREATELEAAAVAAREAAAREAAAAALAAARKSIERLSPLFTFEKREWPATAANRELAQLADRQRQAVIAKRSDAEHTLVAEIAGGRLRAVSKYAYRGEANRLSHNKITVTAGGESRSARLMPTKSVTSALAGVGTEEAELSDAAVLRLIASATGLVKIQIENEAGFFKSFALSPAAQSAIAQTVELCDAMELVNGD